MYNKQTTWLDSGLFESTDLLGVIFSYLEIKDCIAIYRTCSAWFSLADDTFWKNVCTINYMYDSRLRNIRPVIPAKVNKYNRKQVKKMQQAITHDVNWKKEAFNAFARQNPLHIEYITRARKVFCLVVADSDPPKTAKFCTHTTEHLEKIRDEHDRLYHSNGKHLIELYCKACRTRCVLRSETKDQAFAECHDYHVPKSMLVVSTAPDGRANYAGDNKYFLMGIKYTPTLTFSK